MSEEELGPAILYWVNKAGNPAVVNKVLERLKTLNKCSALLRVPMMNMQLETKESCPFIREWTKG